MTKGPEQTLEVEVEKNGLAYIRARLGGALIWESRQYPNAEQAEAALREGLEKGCIENPTIIDQKVDKEAFKTGATLEG